MLKSYFSCCKITDIIFYLHLWFRFTVKSITNIHHNYINILILWTLNKRTIMMHTDIIFYPSNIKILKSIITQEHLQNQSSFSPLFSVFLLSVLFLYNGMPQATTLSITIFHSNKTKSWSECFNLLCNESLACCEQSFRVYEL